MKSKIPSNCGRCKHIGNYTSGPFARNPHHCCELIWELFEEDYRVDPKELDENCPLLNEDFRKGIQALKRK